MTDRAGQSELISRDVRSPHTALAVKTTLSNAHKVHAATSDMAVSN